MITSITYFQIDIRHVNMLYKKVQADKPHYFSINLVVFKGTELFCHNAQKMLPISLITLACLQLQASQCNLGNGEQLFFFYHFQKW